MEFKQIFFINIQNSFKVNNILGIRIKNNKDKINQEFKEEVYKLDCCTCNKAHLGQTGRNFNTKIDEHFKAFNNKIKNKSAYVNHLMLANHKFNPDF